MYCLLVFFITFINLTVDASPTPVTNYGSRTLRRRTVQTSNPGGCLEVQGSNPSSTQYKTVSSAVAALGSGSTTKCIFIYPGTYTEQVTVEYGGPLTIYGYTESNAYHADNQVTITYGETSTQAGNLDASSTVHLYGNNYSIYNVNIVNSYGAGTQAVALTATGNYIGLYACTITGYQDTLYAKSGIQYYNKCYIEGAVDFVFGDAAAWFGDCTIACNGGGSITAQNRASTSDTAWYVFDHSTIEAAPGWTTIGGNYLGRPWGVDSRVIYQYCSLSNVINAAGWTTMVAGATPVYEEYGNTGAGSATTARLYETKATTAVTYEQLWGTSGWENNGF